MGEWVLHLRNLDSRLRGNDKGSVSAFSRLMRGIVPPPHMPNDENSLWLSYF